MAFILFASGELEVTPQAPSRLTSSRVGRKGQFHFRKVFPALFRRQR
jgi:hypothetical protein